MKGTPLINGNVGKAHQIFINILTNSIQSIINTWIIKIETRTNKNNLIIVIEDSGCGIPKDNLAKIATPFFTTKEPGKGTRLGLSITHTLIKELNGKLSFISEVNKGTITTITLPIK